MTLYSVTFNCNKNNKLEKIDNFIVDSTHPPSNPQFLFIFFLFLCTERVQKNIVAVLTVRFTDMILVRTESKSKFCPRKLKCLKVEQ